MALAALFLRLATVLSLKGRTLAGDRVSDSAIAPIDQRAKDQRKPALVVYSDDFAADQVEGRDLLTGSRSLQISIEIVVADQVEQGEEIAVTIPETDEGLELTLNLIERQILRALQFDAEPWSEIWRGLVARVRKVESLRGAGLKDGVRFAARQLVLTVEPLAEPSFGEEARGTWRKFLDQLELEPGLAELVPLLEAEILGQVVPDWRVAQGLLGLTLDGIRGIGIAPPFDAGPIEGAPLLAEIRLRQTDGTDNTDDLVVDPEPEA